jgi:altronate dehydratase
VSWDATLLCARDNVATVLRAVATGETVRVLTPEGVVDVVALEPVPLCHKIACEDVAASADVVKYGWCIGAARTPIRRGAWVHVHNLVSRRAQAPGGSAG